MVIALALIFSSYLKSTFRIDDLFPATNKTTPPLAHIVQVLVQIQKQLCIYVVMYLHVFSELHKEKVYERQYLL